MYVQVYVLKRLIAALAKVSAKVSDEHRVPGKSDFWLFTHPTSTLRVQYLVARTNFPRFDFYLLF